MKRLQWIAFTLVLLCIATLARAADTDAVQNILLPELLDGKAVTAMFTDLQIEAKLDNNAHGELWDRLTVRGQHGKPVLTYTYNKMQASDVKTLVSDFLILETLVHAEETAVFVERWELLYNSRLGDSGARAALMAPLQAFSEFIQDDKNISPLEKELNDRHLKSATAIVGRFLKKYETLTGAPPLSDEETVSLFRDIVGGWMEQFKKYHEAFKLQTTQKEKSWAQWKKKTGTLDRLDQSPRKLDDMIRANDRKSTRRLIECYLPWPMMGAMETVFWKSWLDEIEKKPTPEDSRLLFRGVEYDTDQLFRDGKGGFGFMSTVLTKNQGNYNRRLRSIAVRRLKNGVSSMIESEGVEGLSLLSTQFLNHSADPIGSSFLSFSSDPKVTRDFVGIPNTYAKKRTGGGYLAIRVAKNRGTQNGTAASAFAYEREVLIPLIVFPEDVVVYEEVNSLDGRRDAYENFMDKLQPLLPVNEFKLLSKPDNSVMDPHPMVESFLRSFEEVTTKYKPTPGRCQGVPQ